MAVRLHLDQFRRSAASSVRRASAPVYVVAMHGFLAHSGSLQTFFRALSSHIDDVSRHEGHNVDVRIVCPDARNHGQSPHTPTHRQSDLIHDLESLLHTPPVEGGGYGLQAIAQQHAPSPSSEEPIRVVALGHSMGSGTWGRYLMEHRATEWQCSSKDSPTRPVQVLGLVAFDMPPITATQWNAELHAELASVVEAMEHVNLANITDYRSAHDEFIRCGLTDVRMRGMCSTNLLLPPPRGSAAARIPGAVTQTAWKCNLPVLKVALRERTLFFPDSYFVDRTKRGACVTVPVPVLSLLGGASPVGMDMQLRGLWASHAVEAEEHVIEGATHTVYFDRPKESAVLTVQFLRKLGVL